MADRILTWSIKRCDGNPTVMLPAFYLEADFTPTAVRIYADEAPTDEDAVFEIYDDGVSIMRDNTYSYASYIANTQAYQGAYEIKLPKGANADEMADDFNEVDIEAGSWITCAICKDGGGKNFTVQMELSDESESEEETE